MSDDFVNGILLGFFLGMFIMAYDRFLYKRILLDIAKHGGREKLIDGKFYKIVPEGESDGTA